MAKEIYSAKTAYDNKISASYEEDRVVEPIWEKEQAFVDNYLKSIPERSSILDIPVGTGRFFDYYLKYNHNVMGLDISENMLEQARNNLITQKSNEATIRLSTADITKRPLDKNSVDISICWRLFHLLPVSVLTSAIEELTRVTKKEVIVQTFDTAPRNKVIFLLKSLLKPLKNLLTKSNSHTQSEKWSHIKSFAHDEAFVIKEFRKHNFKLNNRVLLDYYKGTPVNVYLFERIK